MSGRSRKLDVPETKNTQNLFDDLVKEASEREKIVDDEVVGTKKGVFVPPTPTPETKTLKKEVLSDEFVEKSQNSVENPSLEAVLTEILNVPKGKRAVPTFVTFYAARSNAQRHVIVDVVDSVIEEAWAKYVEIKGYEADEEEFMGLLYKITNSDVPRMYRSVGYVTLKKKNLK